MIKNPVNCPEYSTLTHFDEESGTFSQANVFDCQVLYSEMKSGSFAQVGYSKVSTFSSYIMWQSKEVNKTSLRFPHQKLLPHVFDRIRLIFEL